MGKFDDGSATRMAEERIFMWETSDLLDKDLKKSFQEYLFLSKRLIVFMSMRKNMLRLSATMAITEKSW